MLLQELYFYSITFFRKNQIFLLLFLKFFILFLMFAKNAGFSKRGVLNGETADVSGDMIAAATAARKPFGFGAVLPAPHARAENRIGVIPR